LGAFDVAISFLVWLFYTNFRDRLTPRLVSPVLCRFSPVFAVIAGVITGGGRCLRRRGYTGRGGHIGRGRWRWGCEEGLVAGKGLISLALAFDDVLHGLFEITSISR
jgi:hypothetical protein